MVSRGKEALHVSELLESLPQAQAPQEVQAALLSLGYPHVKRCELHKLSFHATYFLEFDAALPSGGGDRAVLQLIGSELGDKALFHTQRFICADSISRATSLAQDVGIRVPKVLVTGTVEEWGRMMNVPFVVYEFITTKTVEDKVLAPGAQLQREIQAIKEKLGSRSLAGVDTEPLPRFEDFYAFIKYLSQLAEQIHDSELQEALQKVEQAFQDAGIQPVPPTLVHQDLNDGNTLLSPDSSGLWKLDALIDWEGAVVTDARICYERGEPWNTLRDLALLTKLRWLAVAASGAMTTVQLPRCCAEELVEDYDEISTRLVSGGWLPSARTLHPFI
eukprot:TRINITY_DN51439_c0_g1_i1.p1 TRINITY_DN51439_c0_g1~~TRINITY_DN51439_c0_g1_i1.p1  ORF type:complete len:355 (+),score=60.23 TRINITY_DN51439_c0_g1_i1:68-1066(+)